VTTDFKWAASFGGYNPENPEKKTEATVYEITRLPKECTLYSARSEIQTLDSQTLKSPDPF